MKAIISLLKHVYFSILESFDIEYGTIKEVIWLGLAIPYALGFCIMLAGLCVTGPGVVSMEQVYNPTFARDAVQLKFDLGLNLVGIGTFQMFQVVATFLIGYLIRHAFVLTKRLKTRTA